MKFEAKNVSRGTIAGQFGLVDDPTPFMCAEVIPMVESRTDINVRRDIVRWEELPHL